MFKNTIKNITAGRQKMFDNGLKMYKEMCPNDNPNKCAQAREAWFVMGNLQTMYQEFDNSICGLTLTALAENIKQYNKFEQQAYIYCRALAPYLRGDEKDRLKALMQADFVTVNGVKVSLSTAANYFSQLQDNLVNTREWIEKAEQSLSNKKYIMYQYYKQLKEIYARFKADQAAQDTLTVFVKVQGEGDGPIEKVIERLKALKKGVEQDIMDHTKCVQDGMYFKLKVVE